MPDGALGRRLANFCTTNTEWNRVSSTMRSAMFIKLPSTETACQIPWNTLEVSHSLYTHRALASEASVFKSRWKCVCCSTAQLQIKCDVLKGNIDLIPNHQDLVIKAKARNPAWRLGVERIPVEWWVYLLFSRWFPYPKTASFLPRTAEPAERGGW